MRQQSLGHGFVFVVRQTEFVGGFFDYFCNFLVVNMRNVWKNMVFHLVVQSSGKEGDKFVVRRKIRCGVQLVYCPSMR